MSVLESIFYKVAGRRPIKKTPVQVFYFVYVENFKITFFI